MMVDHSSANVANREFASRAYRANVGAYWLAGRDFGAFSAVPITRSATGRPDGCFGRPSPSQPFVDFASEPQASSFES